MECGHIKNFPLAGLELGEKDDHDPADGDPASYSAAVIPEQLANEGTELGYETLADPVDGGLWSEELEIDESRVDETMLRQNHKTASRVLAGLARSKTQSGLIPGAVLDELVGTYCLHLTTRFDTERGE